MARPYKRKGSPFYWGDIWFGGKKKSISLKSDNHGVARAKFNQLQASAHEVGLRLPTKTPIGEATENFAAHLANSSRPKSARTDR